LLRHLNPHKCATTPLKNSLVALLALEIEIVENRKISNLEIFIKIIIFFPIFDKSYLESAWVQNAVIQVFGSTLVGYRMAK